MMAADPQVHAASGGSEDDAIRRMIDELERSGELGDFPITFLRDRWMGQLQWFEKKAGKYQKEMNRYRLVLLAGGVLLPVLVNLSATSSEPLIEATAVIVSLVVGFVAGLEAFRRPGERWLQYRQTAELLRAEWWLYVNLAGETYGSFGTRSEALERFVLRVQALIGEDVSNFVALARQSAEPASPDVSALGVGRQP
jgi:hypothetical protein